jgi:hypothetical protein
MPSPLPFSKDRIARTLRRARDFWHGVERGPMFSLLAAPGYRQEPDPDRMVEQACEVIRRDAASGAEDVLPTFFPDFGTVSTSALYGGRRIPGRDGGGVHIEPVVRNLRDLEKLAPCAFEQSDYQLAIDLYRRVCERLESDQVFIRTPDFQGPMNTLGLLMDQTDLLCALYEEPDLVHRALERITETLIAFNDRFRREVGPDKVVGNIWPYTIQPEGCGVAITQDFMPLLGPDLYARFELPLLKRIADHFGGVFIHCCGKYASHLQNLRSGGFKIWGLEMHWPETKIDEIHAVFGDEIAYVPYVAPTGAKEHPALDSFVRSLKGRPCARARFWFSVTDEAPSSVESLREAVRQIQTR